LKPVAESIQWPSAPAHLHLAENEIHVWALPLDLESPALSKAVATLSAAEQDRAKKFRFDKHRNRFIAGRAGLRAMLGRYLQIQPGKLDFAYASRGKPSLSPEFAGARIHFNLAHSEDLALCAITCVAPVGVDVERVRTVKDAADLVARFFSKRESKLFKKLAPDKRPSAFFNLWTRKEAFLKATGEGIGDSLNSVEVSFLPGEQARLLAVASDPGQAVEWTLQDLQPGAGYVGALAIQVTGVAVRTWRWG